MSRLPIVLGIAAASLIVPAFADEQPEKTVMSKIEFHAFVDLYYAYNSNHPVNGLDFQPGTGTTAKQADAFSVNLAELEVSMPADPVGFRISVGAGTGEEVLHASEPGGDEWTHLILASVTYQAHVGRGLSFEGGIMPCHVGMESFFSKDDWNYTRSWMAEYSPYYLTGIKVAYPFTDRWSAAFYVVNGWQIIAENNSAKTFGTHVAYGSDKVSTAFNVLAGPELPGNDSDWRVLGDWLLTVRPTDSWSFGASIDAAREAQPAGESASWWGASIYARYSLQADRYAFALRAEHFDDPEGAISGTAQELNEGTLTFEYRPSKHLIVKLEGRYDKSSADVFATNERDALGQPLLTPGETLVVLGVVANF